MKGRLFVGVDVGSQEHRILALDPEGKTAWSSLVPNTHGGCDEVVAKIEAWRGEGWEVWIGMEGYGGYASPLDARVAVAGALLVPLQPTQVAAYRKMSQVQPDKNDEADARLLAQMLIWFSQRGEMEPRQPTEEYFQALRETSRAFQEATASKVSLQLQFAEKVREYWPELILRKERLRGTDGAGFLALLAKYPTPEAVARAGRRRIVDLLKKATGRDHSALAEELVEEALRLRGQAPVSQVTASLIQRLAENLKRLVENVESLEKLLEKLLTQHPFGRFLLDQSGIGPRTAGCFLGEAGDLGRYATDSKLARCAGNGPIGVQSGTAPVRHYDGHRYNHRLKRAILLMARSRARWDERSKQYVEKRVNQGDNYWRAIKKLARFILRFLWKAWRYVVKPAPQELAQQQEFLLGIP